VSLGFVMDEVSLEDFSVLEDDFPLTAHLVVFPASLVNSSVPDEFSFSVFHAVLPLSDIVRPILKMNILSESLDLLEYSC